MTNDLYLKMAVEKYSILIEKETQAESLPYACNQMCKDHKFTFVYIELYESLLHKLVKLGYCRIIKVPDPLYLNWIAIKLREQSPYLRIFNRM